MNENLLSDPLPQHPSQTRPMGFQFNNPGILKYILIEENKSDQAEENDGHQIEGKMGDAGDMAQQLRAPDALAGNPGPRTYQEAHSYL